MKIFEKETQERLMKIVMKEVDKAINEGNRPFASLLVDYNGNIIVKAHNKSRTNVDPTAHSEILLIRKACKKLNTRDLSNYVIISNMESCSMCSSAIIKAQIKTIIYGAEFEDNCNPNIHVKDVISKCNYKVNVINKVLENETRKQVLNTK